MSYVLEINSLTKKFGDFIAVDHMSLNVREGEIFGFLGANGAGKSTTINMIASLLRSTKGEIRLLGKNIAKDAKFAKMNTGIVPQELAIYEGTNRTWLQPFLLRQRLDHSFLWTPGYLRQIAEAS